MSRDRDTASIPRAVTPRDAKLAAAIARIRAESPEWDFAAIIGEEVLEQRREVDDLREDKAQRDGVIKKLKGWVAGGWVVAALALGGGLVDYGTRRGRSESADAAVVKARNDIDLVQRAVVALDRGLAELVRDVRGLERQFDRRHGDTP